MVFLIHFIFGTLTYYISGQNVERFLNLCAKNHLVLWNLKPEEDGYYFIVRKKHNEDLLSMAEKTNVKLLLKGRQGLPFFLLHHKKRKMLFFALGMFSFVIFLLSQFVWEITISGNEVYSKNTILKYVTSNYYQIGTYKGKIDCNLLEDQLREDYDEIAWVSCSLNGTRLHVEIKETLDRKTKHNAKSPCDIVANKDGIITKLSVRNGTPLYSVGEKVKKGNTIISGLIYYYSDDYAVTQTDKTKADGAIWMQVKEAYKESIPIKVYEKQFNKEKVSIKSIYIGKYRWNLRKNAKEVNTVSIKKDHPFHIGTSIYLPFGYETIEKKQYETKGKIYSKEEGEKILRKRLNQYLQQKKKKGIKILKEEIAIKQRNNQYVATGTLILEEPVGKIRSIRSLTKKEEEKIAPTTAYQ